MKNKLLIFALIFLLTGCAAIVPHGRHKLYDGIDAPRDRDDLTVTIEYVGAWEASRRCNELAGLPNGLFLTLGCATVYLGNKCHLILGNDSPELLEHEMRHCEGWEW